MSSSNPLQSLESGMSSFTKSEAAAAHYFLKHPTSILSSTVTKASELTGQSTAAIVRMCQRMGYSGYAEFRFAMNRHLVFRGADGDEVAESPIREDRLANVGQPSDSFTRLADVYGSYMRRVVEEIDIEVLNKIACDICRAKRLSIWGVNRTFESASQLSNRLFRIGIFNQVTSDFMIMDDVGAILGEGDACVLFSVSGRGYRSYPLLMDSMRDRGCSVTFITMNPKLEHIKHATRCVVLPWVSNDHVATALEDQMVFFMFIELLLNEVAHILNAA